MRQMDEDELLVAVAVAKHLDAVAHCDLHGQHEDGLTRKLQFDGTTGCSPLPVLRGPPSVELQEFPTPNVRAYPAGHVSPRYEVQIVVRRLEP